MKPNIKKDSFAWPSDEKLLIRYRTEQHNASEFKKPVIEEWHQNENQLYGKKPKTLSKRSNIMIQLMAGFEDTLLSKLKDPVEISFSPTEHSDINKAKKVTAAWKTESSVSNEDWEYKDLLIKKLAMVSGRGILKITASYPYHHHLYPIDHYDFLIDPLTSGLDLESARYMIQENILISKFQLEHSLSYNKTAVKKIIDSYPEGETESPDTEDNDKSNRFEVLGLNFNDFCNSGETAYKFSEWYTTINGTRVVILLETEKEIIVKKRILSGVTGSITEDAKAFWPFESWAYYPDLFNFWSPAPMTRVRELFILRNVSLNQMFDNNEQINKPMKAYDPKVYTNPALLTYQPDRVIPVAPGRDPQTGIYSFPTQSIIEPSQFNSILEELGGKITGVTPSGAGLSDTKKVGIYYGDQQEVAKRMTLFEISYNRAHLRLAQKYLKYLSEYLDANAAIKILGTDGVSYEELKRDDLAAFDVALAGGISKVSHDAIEKKTKNDYLLSQMQNPLFNQTFLIELGMMMNGFSHEEIKRATSQNEIDEDQVIRAEEDIERILNKKDFLPYQKAEIQYMETIFDFVSREELSKVDTDLFYLYLQELQPIVTQNMVKKAQHELSLKGMLEVPQQFIANSQQQGVNAHGNQIMSQNGLDQQQAQEVPSQVQKTYEK